MKKIIQPKLNFGTELLADLHVHSNFSDGIYPPEKLLAMAEDAGLVAISLTDHDSIGGCKKALSVVHNYKIDFITGIEFSCYEKEREIHILGYNIDIGNKMLNEYIAQFYKTRLKRAELIVQKLNKHGVALNLEDIIERAGDAPVVRPHIAAALIDKGYVKSWKQAFTEYLAEGSKAFFPKAHFSVSASIELIKKAGGIAVLAHPTRSLTHATVMDIIKKGIDGIEVTHPMHDTKTEAYYRELCTQYNLIATGGSDYHGCRDYDDTNFGRFAVPYSVVEQIREKLSVNK